MLTEAFNPHHQVLQTYDDLAMMVAFRYGTQAQGLVFVLYDELITLRRILVDHPEAFVVRAWAHDVTRRLRERYRDQPVSPAPDHPTAVVSRHPVVVEYARNVFDAKYGEIIPIIEKEIIELTGPVLPQLRSGRPYMYVIDECGRFLVWNRAFTFEELVFGRNKATVNGVAVGHPMLVPQRLRASAAGEVVFIGTPRVQAVIANNKSGHFRFPPSCRAVIETRLRDILQLPGDAIDVFIVGGFDEHLVQRTHVLRESVPSAREGKAT